MPVLLVPDQQQQARIRLLSLQLQHWHSRTVLANAAVAGPATLACRRMWDRWFMMGGIGFTVGLIGFLLYTFIGIFGAVKYHTVRSGATGQLQQQTCALLRCNDQATGLLWQCRLQLYRQHSCQARGNFSLQLSARFQSAPLVQMAYQPHQPVCGMAVQHDIQPGPRLPGHLDGGHHRASGGGGRALLKSLPTSTGAAYPRWAGGTAAPS